MVLFKEIIGNAFSNPYLEQVDAICITTNMSTKRNGKAVMGAGIAKDAKSRFHGIDEDLGKIIREKGSVVFPIRDENFSVEKGCKEITIVCLPTKFEWWEQASLSLVEESVRKLVNLTNERGWKKVILPRPGVMNGKLDWEAVKPILEKYLDERFLVIKRR
jgi:hypothetical protein